MSQDDMGDRLKGLEQAEAGRKLIPLLPICVRLDGKGFSKFTRKLNRPYDESFSKLMVAVTKELVEESNAVVGYTQSDEISLVLYSGDYKSQIFFDGKIQKLTSVLASMATGYFNHFKTEALKGKDTPAIGYFDCRVWNVPTKTEAANTILWRELDASKNSISMAASHYFSHKSLQNMTGNEKKQRMLEEKNVVWEDYPTFFKRGTFVQRVRKLITLGSEELARIPAQHRPTGPIERSVCEAVEMPVFSTVTNREAVIFDGAKPEVKQAGGFELVTWNTKNEIP